MAGWGDVPQAVLWGAGLISVSSVLGDTFKARDWETRKRCSNEESRFPALSRVAQVAKRILAFPGYTHYLMCPEFITRIKSKFHKVHS